jgi:hypothetical protein
MPAVLGCGRLFLANGGANGLQPLRQENVPRCCGEMSVIRHPEIFRLTKQWPWQISANADLEPYSSFNLFR